MDVLKRTEKRGEETICGHGLMEWIELMSCGHCLDQPNIAPRENSFVVVAMFEQ
jgi:hypothetical protein